MHVICMYTHMHIFIQDASFYKQSLLYILKDNMNSSELFGLTLGITLSVFCEQV